MPTLRTFHFAHFDHEGLHQLQNSFVVHEDSIAAEEDLRGWNILQLTSFCRCYENCSIYSTSKTKFRCRSMSLYHIMRTLADTLDLLHATPSKRVSACASRYQYYWQLTTGASVWTIYFSWIDQPTYAHCSLGWAHSWSFPEWLWPWWALCSSLFQHWLKWDFGLYRS